MPAGRPPHFESPDELQDKIDEYFANQNFVSERPTITGLCLYCGFESRQSFYAYEQKEEFSYTIKNARLRIEEVYERYLFSSHSTGAIFALKNFGWSDKQEIDHTTGGDKMAFNLTVKGEKD